jgi:hypothetical protein
LTLAGALLSVFARHRLSGISVSATAGRGGASEPGGEDDGSEPSSLKYQYISDTARLGSGRNH